MVSGIKVDPQTGEMKVAWQILTPPFDCDLGSTGKGPSSGWVFCTCYNTEMAHDVLEVNSRQKDRDLCAVVNWRAAEKAVADGKATHDGRRADARSGESSRRFVFRPDRQIAARHGCRSKRQMDRCGRKASAGDDCAELRKVQAAINNKTFEGDFRGVPILKYEAVVEGEVPVGLGPLHTQYDGKGNRLHFDVHRFEHHEMEIAALDR